MLANAIFKPILACLAALLTVNYATGNLLIPDKFKGNPNHPVSVVFVEPDNIKTFCGDAGNGFKFVACVRGGMVFLPNPCDYPEYKDVNSYARLVCHEKAHVMGWHHPDNI